MTDVLNSIDLTLFDGIVFALIAISALMALARGFIRELASILAFVVALVAAFFTYLYLSPMVHEALPETISQLTTQIATVAAAFLIVYIFAAWFGKKFSKFVHTATDIGFIDRLIGLIFGIARGGVIVVLLLFVAHPFLEEAQLSWVVNSFSYKYFIEAVFWVQSIMPAVTENVQSVLPDSLSDSP